MIDVHAGIMSFQLCGKQVDFCFPLSIPSSVSNVHLVPAAPIFSIPPAVVSEIEVFEGDGGSHMRSITFSDYCPPIPTSLVGTSARTRD